MNEERVDLKEGEALYQEVRRCAKELNNAIARVVQREHALQVNERRNARVEDKSQAVGVLLCRIAFILKQSWGLTPAEIGVIFRLSPETVRHYCARYEALLLNGEEEL